jgi:hypothetical protein
MSTVDVDIVYQESQIVQRVIVVARATRGQVRVLAGCLVVWYDLRSFGQRAVLSICVVGGMS